MAKFNMGEKASKEEAIDSLTELIGSIYNGVYHVRNTSDDGGQIYYTLAQSGKVGGLSSSKCHRATSMRSSSQSNAMIIEKNKKTLNKTQCLYV